MGVPLLRACCWTVPLRTGCLVAGWYDIIYGHVMILVYLLSFYTGYFNTTDVYKTALWLDFAFTIVQLFGGVCLVYGLKRRRAGLVLTYSLLGVVLIVVDVIGDLLLALTFQRDVTTVVKIICAGFLITFIVVRAYTSWCALSYYEELKNVIAMRKKLHSTIPDIIRYSS